MFFVDPSLKSDVIATQCYLPCRLFLNKYYDIFNRTLLDNYFLVSLHNTQDTMKLPQLYEQIEDAPLICQHL